jgi:hypothetical protein
MSTKPEDEVDEPSKLERELLGVARGAFEPPPGEEDRTWAALSGRVAAPGGSSGAKPNAAGTAASSWPRWGAVIGACAILIGVGSVALRGSAPERAATPASGRVASPPSASPPIATAATPAATDNAAVPEASAAPIAAAPVAAGAGNDARQVAVPHAASAGSSPKPVSSAAGSAAPAPLSAPELASRLREETALLSQARGQLRQGDPSGALATLNLSRSKFPDGVLAQEREALTIEALSRSGQTDEAKQREQSFVREHPDSPHSQRLERVVP